MMLIPKRGKPAKDKAHLAKIHELPCVICQSWPVQAHHVCHGRFSQAKADDTASIPLCKAHHDELHNGKQSWAAKYGEDHTYLPRVAEMLRQMEEQTI